MLYFVVPASYTDAEVAELADALASGASGGNPMKVRVLSSAPAFAHRSRELRLGRPARYQIPRRLSSRSSAAAKGGRLYAGNWHGDVWKPAREAAGFPTLRFHDLRHSAVPLWVEMGANLLQVSRWLGHSSVQITAASTRRRWAT